MTDYIDPATLTDEWVPALLIWPATDETACREVSRRGFRSASDAPIAQWGRSSVRIVHLLAPAQDDPWVEVKDWPALPDGTRKKYSEEWVKGSGEVAPMRRFVHRDDLHPEPDPEAERVERVAKAICEEDFQRPPVLMPGLYLDLARAAIAAYEAQP